jgi:hypothetical protein
MSATNSLHYQLCCEGAKWLRNKKNREGYRGHWKYIWVEPGLIGENHRICYCPECAKKLGVR